jgi:D-amino peptidase
MRSCLSLAVAAVLLIPSPALAQNPVYRTPRLPAPTGFRVMIVPDMEGMGSTIMGAEVSGATAPGTIYSDYWTNFRSLLTKEVNAVITGARRGGGRDFVVTEGHGANRWASTLPWELDSAAILIRGWPKPLSMISGIDSTVGTLMVIGAHANAGTAGVLAHHFVFDTFAVNGKILNEASTFALVAGAFGVSVSMVAGDDILVEETKQMLGNGVIGVVVKQAISRTAALTWSPARVRQMLADSAAVAVRREMAGDFKPFTMAGPYNVRYSLRATFTDSVVALIDGQKFPGVERISGRNYRFTTSDVKQIGYLLDVLEHPLVR